jgi:hypothetical protein
MFDWIKLSLIGLKNISFRPIEGKDFWKGYELSPYCSNKFLRSFLPEKFTPCNSEFSLSNQLAEEKISEIEFRVTLLSKDLETWEFLRLLQKIKNLSWFKNELKL